MNPNAPKPRPAHLFSKRSAFGPRVEDAAFLNYWLGGAVTPMTYAADSAIGSAQARNVTRESLGLGSGGWGLPLLNGEKSRLLPTAGQRLHGVGTKESSCHAHLRRSFSANKGKSRGKQPPGGYKRYQRPADREAKGSRTDAACLSCRALRPLSCVREAPRSASWSRSSKPPQSSRRSPAARIPPACPCRSDPSLPARASVISWSTHGTGGRTRTTSPSALLRLPHLSLSAREEEATAEGSGAPWSAPQETTKKREAPTAVLAATGT